VLRDCPVRLVYLELWEPEDLVAQLELLDSQVNWDPLVSLAYPDQAEPRDQQDLLESREFPGRQELLDHLEQPVLVGWLDLPDHLVRPEVLEERELLEQAVVPDQPVRSAQVDHPDLPERQVQLVLRVPLDRQEHLVPQEFPVQLDQVA